MNLQFRGATGAVTGSKYLLRHAGGNVLVDCSLFQGYSRPKANTAVRSTEVA